MDKYCFKKIIDIPIFPSKLLVMFTNDRDEIDEIDGSDSYGKDELIVGYCNMGSYKGSNTILIAFNPKYKYEGDTFKHGDVNHEVVHAVDKLYEYIGAKYDNYSNEIYAYIVGWFTDQVYEFMKECKLKIK